jgi:hypothetical protein
VSAILPHLIKAIKFEQMKRAKQILTYKGMINGEKHLLPLKNKN